ncbi:hypothetical protein GCM10018966_036820 [Streptomyces yanii]
MTTLQSVPALGTHPASGSLPSRAETREQLSKATYDLLVIGGGILGISTAWHAAQSGLRVALVDAGDFAGATSSASSKLLHGGLRYLQTGAVKLVAENHFERRAVSRQVAPHLANPLTFYLPVYKGGPHGAAKLGAGVFAYSALSAFGDGVGHVISPARAQRDVPELRTDNLKAVAVYGDDQMNDARMALMTVRAAVDAGAVVLNHAAVTGLRFTKGRVTGADLEDRTDGTEFGVTARLVLNATGPWVDHLRKMEDPNAAPSIRLSKGAHLVLKRTRPWKAALATPIDKYRITFALPWEDMLLLGTTDEEYEGDPADVAVNEKDTAQILDEAAFSIKDQQLSPRSDHVLLRGSAGAAGRSRRHLQGQARDGRDGGPRRDALGRGRQVDDLPPHRPYGDEQAGRAPRAPAGRGHGAHGASAEEAPAARYRQPERGGAPAADRRWSARTADVRRHRPAPRHALRLALLRHRAAGEREPGAGRAHPPGRAGDLGTGRLRA